MERWWLSAVFWKARKRGGLSSRHRQSLEPPEMGTRWARDRVQIQGKTAQDAMPVGKSLDQTLFLSCVSLGTGAPRRERAHGRDRILSAGAERISLRGLQPSANVAMTAACRLFSLPKDNRRRARAKGAQRPISSRTPAAMARIAITAPICAKEMLTKNIAP